MFNKKPRICSFSDVAFQNFPRLTVKLCEMILLNCKECQICVAF